MDPRPVQLEDLIAQVISLEPDGTSLAHLSDAVSTAAHLAELADQLIEHFVNEARRDRRVVDRDRPAYRSQQASRP